MPNELSEADVNALRMDCYYANPATDRAVILSAMSKTSAARQQWIRSQQPSITEVLEQYPRMEDMPLDMVCANVECDCKVAVVMFCFKANLFCTVHILCCSDTFIAYNLPVRF